MKKFNISTSEFQSALARAFAVTPAKQILQALGNIHLKAEKGFLYIRSTDMEIGFVEKIKIQAKSEGEALIDAKNLSSLVNLFSADSSIDVEFTEKGISLQSPEGKYNFTSQEGTLPDLFLPFKPKESFMISADVLSKMISLVNFAVMTGKDAQFHVNMTGVALQIGDKEIKLYGTNSRVISKVSTPIDSKGTISILIPQKTALIILKSFSGEDVTVSLSENQIEIKSDSINIISLLIADTPPNYERVLASLKNDSIVICKQQKLLDSLRRVSFFMDDEVKKITLNLTKNVLSLNVVDAETATDGVETIPVEYKGEDFQIHLSGKYLQDCISRIETENVVMQFADTKPCLILPEEQGVLKQEIMIARIT